MSVLAEIRGSAAIAGKGLDNEVLSTRDVARLLGVSEATVKRWSDESLIECYRTPGGHRKFKRPQVAAFMESHRFADASAVLRAPELTSKELLRVALEGDSLALLHLVQAALGRGLTLGELLDAHVGPALLEVGEQWACAGLSVAQEHLVSTTITELLSRLGDDFRADPTRGSAITGCLEGERHDIGARMAGLVLRSRGVRVLAIGADTPTEDLATLVERQRPRIVALSGIYNPENAKGPVARVAAAADSVGASVFVGGEAWKNAETLPSSVSFVRDMRSFAAALDTLLGLDR